MNHIALIAAVGSLLLGIAVGMMLVPDTLADALETMQAGKDASAIEQECIQCRQMCSVLGH